MKKIGLAAFVIIGLWMFFIPSVIFTGNAQSRATEEELLAEYLKTKEPKAIKTKSGMYYVIISQGTGALPKTGQTVLVHHRGTFLDGKEFDNDHGMAYGFTLGRQDVIAGWDEGFALLKKGTKARFIIPSKLAYGSQGAGGVIPPNTPLLFEVELVDIQ